MPKVRSGDRKRKSRPALTPEARENQMVAYATDLAEQQLLDGSASPSVIVHYLKLGSIKAQAELEKLKSENELLLAKTEAIHSMKNMEELYSEAMSAMRNYGIGSVIEDNNEPEL